MLPKESVDLLKAILKEQYIKLSKDEVMALVTVDQEEYVTNNRLQQLLDTHAINSNKILSTLVDKGYLEADGIGRGTKYYLSEIFNNNYLLWNENDKNQNNDKRSSNEEKLIINYINNNKFITNLIARNELGFSKTTASRLFNRLIEKGAIVRIG